MQQAQKQSYAAVDIAKFVAAILVVVIHVNPLTGLASTLLRDGLARLAVPLFFAASGYFLAHKGIENKDAVVSFCKRILLLSLPWSVLTYFLPGILENLPKALTVLADSNRTWLWLGKFLFPGHGQFWYLTASVCAVAILFALRRYLPRKVVLPIACAAYLWMLLGNEFHEVARRIPVLRYSFTLLKAFGADVRNGVLLFLFVYIGVLLYESEALRKLRTSACWLGLAASLSVLTLELLALTRHRPAEYYATFPFIVFFLFNLLLRARLRPRPVYTWLRNASTLLFCVHILVARIYEQLSGVPYAEGGVPAFCFTLGVSLLFSFAVLALEKKWEFLRRLH
ncbi:MAG: acyltransferase [Oscillospiraceae bacterium]|jgi:serine/alanine racemase|nr:acyltransferase [Oscillospiraceae bacterium]